MRDIERRMARLESAGGATLEAIETWIIDGGTATNMATGEVTTWGELDHRPAAPHTFRIGVLVVDAPEDLEERP